VIVLRSLAGIVGVLLGVVLLVLGVVLAPVLILLAPLPLLVIGAWKFWRLRRQADRGIKRGRRRVRKLRKRVGRRL
jgi:hypothetical protein